MNNYLPSKNFFLVCIIYKIYEVQRIFTNDFQSIKTSKKKARAHASKLLTLKKNAIIKKNFLKSENLLISTINVKMPSRWRLSNIRHKMKQCRAFRDLEK